MSCCGNPHIDKISCFSFTRRKMFNFNLQQVNGYDIRRSIGYGVRRYLLNMNDETLPKARRTVKMFYMLDVALKTAGVGLVGYGIYRVLRKDEKMAESNLVADESGNIALNNLRE